MNGYLVYWVTIIVYLVFLWIHSILDVVFVRALPSFTGFSSSSTCFNHVCPGFNKKIQIIKKRNSWSNLIWSRYCNPKLEPGFVFFSRGFILLAGRFFGGRTVFTRPECGFIRGNKEWIIWLGPTGGSGAGAAIIGATCRVPQWAEFFYFFIFFFSLFYLLFFFLPSAGRSDTVGRRWNVPVPALVSFHRDGFTAFWLWVLPALTEVGSGLTGFFWVFTGFYWFFLGFTMFYWVLPSFSQFQQVWNGFYWVLLGFTGFYWVLLSFNGF